MKLKAPYYPKKNNNLNHKSSVNYMDKINIESFPYMEEEFNKEDDDESDTICNEEFDLLKDF